MAYHFCLCGFWFLTLYHFGEVTFKSYWNLFEVACQFGETEVFPGKYWPDFQFVNYELGSPDCILELDSPGQSSVQLSSVSNCSLPCCHLGLFVYL